MNEGYGSLLKRYRERRRIPLRELEQRVGVGRTLLSRTENGGRQPASREEVASLAAALELSTEEADRMFTAAGYWPTAVHALGPNDPTINRIARALTDSALRPDAREHLRRCIDGVLTLLEALAPARENDAGKP